MYYEEAVIDGVLCYRGGPNDEWKKIDYAGLLRRYNALVDTVRQMRQNAADAAQEQDLNA